MEDTVLVVKIKDIVLKVEHYGCLERELFDWMLVQINNLAFKSITFKN